MTNEQKRMLKSFKNSITEEGIEQLPDDDLLRFLTGFRWDTARAFDVYKREREWFHRVRPDLIQPSTLKPEVLSGLVYFFDPPILDSHSNLVVFIDAAKFNKKETSEERLTPLVLWLVEETMRRFTRPDQKLSLVVSMKNLKWKKFYDRHSFSHVATMLSEFYCERMGDTYVVDPPPLFKMGWTFIRGFLEKHTCDKIHVVSSKELLQFFEVDDLPKAFGGMHPDFDKNTFSNTIGLDQSS